MPPISISQVKEVNARARCIYSKEQVEAALDVMAAAITKFLVERDPILPVSYTHLTLQTILLV